jgi:hypothetical protein
MNKNLGNEQTNSCRVTGHSESSEINQKNEARRSIKVDEPKTGRRKRSDGGSVASLRRIGNKIEWLVGNTPNVQLWI